LNADQKKRDVSIRTLILAAVSSYMLASCLLFPSSERQEISDLPGAVIHTEGKSSVSGIYQEAAQLFDGKKFEEAELLYRQVIRIEPSSQYGYVGLGASLLYQNRLEEAQRAYQLALDLSPNSAGALIGLGSVHYLQGRYLEADELYSQALELDGDDPDAHWGRAIALEQLGEVEEAVYHLERFIELAPDSQLANDANLLIEKLKSKDVEGD
jgi:tetratricopeptide (TPR) repeat protein